MTTKVPAETMRRVMNVWDQLVLAAIVAVFTMIFFTRDAVIKLQLTQEATNETLKDLRVQLAAVPALTSRVIKNESKNEEQDRRLDKLEQQIGRTP